MRLDCPGGQNYGGEHGAAQSADAGSGQNVANRFVRRARDAAAHGDQFGRDADGDLFGS